MKSCEFLAIGDLHLNSMTNLFPNYAFNPNTLIYKALKIPLDYAKDEGIKYIILLGDLFDNPSPNQESQKELLEFIMKYSHLKIFAIAGNHDYSSTEEISLKMAQFSTLISDKLDHFKIITEPKLYNIQGIPFSFLPWPHCRTLKTPSVNIAHIEVPGSTSDSGKLLKSNYVISKKGIWYIGHLHTKQEIDNYAYYPGNLYQKNFGERLNKGFYHVKVKYDGVNLKSKHEFIAIKSPFTLHNIRIKKPKDFDLVTLPNPNDIKQYKLFVSKDVEIPIGFLEKYPNVVDVAGKLSLKEINTLNNEGFEIESSNIDFNVLDGLETFMIKDGLDNKQVHRAKIIVENILKGV